VQVLLPHGTAALSSAGDAELHHRGYDKVVFWKLSDRPAGRTIGAG